MPQGDKPYRVSCHHQTAEAKVAAATTAHQNFCPICWWYRFKFLELQQRSFSIAIITHPLDVLVVVRKLVAISQGHECIYLFSFDSLCAFMNLTIIVIVYSQGLSNLWTVPCYFLVQFGAWWSDLSSSYLMFGHTYLESFNLKLSVMVISWDSRRG